MPKPQQYKIYQELDDVKQNFETGRSERIAGLYRSPYKVIKMCEFYSASRYLGSTPLVMSNGVLEVEYNKDALGRDKPFYNIVNFRVALAKTATDLDVHDIQIVADNPKYRVQSMLLNREAYEWMKTDFGQTLNKMGSTRPKYGGYLVKKSEIDGKLKIEVLDWTKVYTDIIDILGGPIMELHSMSPVTLKSKDGAWDNVNEVLKAHKGLKDKNKSNKIDVYEILGEFPKCDYNELNEIDDADDEFEFSLQKYFIAEVGGKKFVLYSNLPKGKITDYYEYLSWEDQSLDLGRGVIEDSEEAQVWTNDAVINEKNAMDLAGRVGIKTTSKKVGANILEHDHGKIYELEAGTDMASFNLAPSSLGEYQNQIDKWKQQANDATSSYDAQTGETPPAGTPYSQTALLNQVSSKPFDYKREEWGLHLTKIVDGWVIPFLIKKLKKSHTLSSSDFTDEEIEMIDESISNAESNKVITDHVLAGGMPPSPEDQQNMISDLKRQLRKNGKKRYINLPANYFDDIETKTTVITTGEQKNKTVIMQSLSDLLHDVQGSYNPNTGKFGILEDPTLSKIFAEIVELAGTGISPISLGLGSTKPTVSPVAPQATSQSQPSPMQPSQPLAATGMAPM